MLRSPCSILRKIGFPAACTVGPARRTVPALLERRTIARPHFPPCAMLPLSSYGLPAQAKALIDRSQRFYESRACEHNKAANALCPRALSLFVSGRRKGDMLFAGSHLALKYFFAALGITYAGSLALRGLEAPSDVTAETKQDLLRAAKILAHSIEKDCPDIASAITKACPRIENALPA